MTQRNDAMARTFAEAVRREASEAPDVGIGGDLERVDSDVITFEEYLDIPEIDDDPETFDIYHGDTLVRRGRPAPPRVTEALTLNLPPDLIAYFRAYGPGWELRIEDVLRAARSVLQDTAERQAAERDRATGTKPD